MAFLSHGRWTDEAGTYLEDVSFFGSSPEETEAEMQQWVMRTMPLGACYVYLKTTHSMDGQQHHILLSYSCRQQDEAHVVPTGLFGTEI